MQPHIEITKLLHFAWGRRLWVLAFVGAAVCLGVLYVATVRPTYETRMVLAPVERESPVGSLARLAESVAGIDLLQSKGNRFMLFAARLTSLEVADRMEKNHHFVHRLQKAGLYVDGVWHEQSKSWLPPARRSLSRALRNAIYGLLGLPTDWVPPSGATLQKFLEDELKISRNRESGLLTVVLNHPDPVLSRELLAALYIETESVFRDEERRNARVQIEYIEEQLKTTTIVETRQALAQTLQRLVGIEVMSGVGVPFVASLFEAPRSSVYPTRPKPLLVMILAALFGGVFGVAATMTHGMMVESRAPRTGALYAAGE